MHLSLVLTGLFFLLVGSFLDNMRGPLLPAITHALSLNYSESSWLFIAGSLGSVAGIFSLIPILQAFSEKAVALGICALAILSVVLAKTVSGFWSLVFFATLIGATVSLLGSLANILVMQGSDHQKRARYFCVLHMMYGIGSLLAPLCVAFLLEKTGAWESPFYSLVPVLILATTVSIFYLPKKDVSKAILKQPAGLNLFQFFVVLVFSFYVMGEVLTSMWMVTYLVEGSHYTVSEASPYVTGFFIMMALTRGLCFISIQSHYEKVIIIGCLILGCLAFFLGINGRPLALSLVGVIGPFFPILLARVGKRFPHQSRPLTLWVLGFNQLALVFSHIGMGKMTDHFGVNRSYYMPGVFLVIAVLVTALYFPLERKQGAA